MVNHWVLPLANWSSAPRTKLTCWARCPERSRDVGLQLAVVKIGTICRSTDLLDVHRLEIVGRERPSCYPVTRMSPILSNESRVTTRCQDGIGVEAPASAGCDADRPCNFSAISLIAENRCRHWRSTMSCVLRQGMVGKPGTSIGSAARRAIPAAPFSILRRAIASRGRLNCYEPSPVPPSVSDIMPRTWTSSGSTTNTGWRGRTGAASKRSRATRPTGRRGPIHVDTDLARSSEDNRRARPTLRDRRRADAAAAPALHDHAVGRICDEGRVAARRETRCRHSRCGRMIEGATRRPPACEDLARRGGCSILP